jgi:hypothetical protein
MLKYILIGVALTVILSCDRSTPLAMYEPKSSQEQALKSVLLQFEEGVRNRDADKVIHLIHENASIMLDRQFVSRAAYAEILPQRLADDSRMTLGTPRMTVSGDSAVIKIYMTRGDNRFLVIFTMKMENGSWYILGWEY